MQRIPAIQLRFLYRLQIVQPHNYLLRRIVMTVIDMLLVI